MPPLHLPCRNAVTERYGVEAPATLIFDHPTLAALAAWLASQLAPRYGPAAPAASHGKPGASSALMPRSAGSEAGLVAVAGVSALLPSTLGGSGLAGFWGQAAAGADVQAVVPLSKWDAGKWQEACCFGSLRLCC